MKQPAICFVHSFWNFLVVTYAAQPTRMSSAKCEVQNCAYIRPSFECAARFFFGFALEYKTKALRLTCYRLSRTYGSPLVLKNSLAFIHVALQRHGVADPCENIISSVQDPNATFRSFPYPFFLFFSNFASPSWIRTEFDYEGITQRTWRGEGDIPGYFCCLCDGRSDG